MPAMSRIAIDRAALPDPGWERFIVASVPCRRRWSSVCVVLTRRRGRG